MAESPKEQASQPNRRVSHKKRASIENFAFGKVSQYTSVPRDKCPIERMSSIYTYDAAEIHKEVLEQITINYSLIPCSFFHKKMIKFTGKNWSFSDKLCHKYIQK